MMGTRSSKLCRTRRLILLGGAFLFFCASAHADEFTWTQPDVRPLSPVIALRPNPSVRMAGPGWPGQSRVDIAVAWANIWNYDEAHGRYIIDGEWTYTSLSYSYAVNEQWLVGFSVPYVSRSGGFADGTIEGFHDTFGLDNYAREDAPRDDVRVEFVQEGVTTGLDGDSSGVGDLTFYTSYVMERDSEKGTLWAVQLGGSVPTGDEQELEGLGGATVALGLSGARELSEKWIAYGTVQAGIGTEDEILGVAMREEFGSLGVGLEYATESSSSYFIQWFAFSPWAEDFDEYSDVVHEIQFGGNWYVGENALLKIALIENALRFKNSVDVGMQVAWSLFY